MSSINTLRLARPAILENLASYFHTNLSKYISIEEMVGMVVFIEYFSNEIDRGIIREGYFTNLAERFAKHDLGRKTWQEVMVHAVHNEPAVNVKPYMLNRSEAVYIKESILQDIDPSIKPKILTYEDTFQKAVGGMSDVMRYQRRHQNIFLEIGEYIEKIYQAIYQYYLHSGHNRTLMELSGRCYGGVPRISSYTCTHIDIQVAFGEVF